MLDTAYAFVLEQEAGWYDGTHQRDPNPTMNGVTQRVYDRFCSKYDWLVQSVKYITPEQQRFIYESYWTEAKCDDVNAIAGWFIATILFDAAVNSGPKRARMLLQQALHVHDDGIIGPVTLDALRQANDDPLFPARFIFRRLAWYDDILTRKPSRRGNAHGWMARVLSLASAGGLL